MVARGVSWYFARGFKARELETMTEKNPAPTGNRNAGSRTPKSGVLLERRSIDYVPLAERHGKVWHLWPVWFSGDAHLATIAVGFVGVALGGSLSWSLLAVTLGSALGT